MYLVLILTRFCITIFIVIADIHHRMAGAGYTRIKFKEAVVIRMTDEQIKEVVEISHKIRRDFFVEYEAPYYSFILFFKEYKVKIQYKHHKAHLKKENNEFIISLPLCTPTEIDNFTVAHKIGHIAMGHTLEGMSSVYKDGNIPLEDKQANIFAAELLMPEYMFRNVCEECRNDVNWVAYSFNVSPSIAGARMDTLGIKRKKNDRR